MQYILHKDKGPIRQPSLSPKDVLTSNLLSLSEKLSLAKILPTVALQIPNNDVRDLTSAAHLDTESAYEYIKKYSNNFADYVIEPTMQMFCGYEKEDYSKAWFIWLMAGLAWSGKWWSFKERGVGALSYEFEKRFKANKNVNLQLNSLVKDIKYDDTQVEVSYLVCDEIKYEVADMLVIAVPAPLIPKFMPSLDKERKHFFESTGYVGHHITYFLIESKEELVYGLTLPTEAGYTMVSNIHFYPHGDGRYLVTGELKGNFCKKTLGLSSDEILDMVWPEFVKAEPKSANAKFINRYLQRNDLAICRREVGFIKKLKKFKELRPIKRVSFAGDYMINSTVGQSHWSGNLAAEELFERCK